MSQKSTRASDRRQVVNPFSRKYGWRSGIEILAGKTIRKDADGFEDFRDYLSESEAETTSEFSAVEDVSVLKENRQNPYPPSKLAGKYLPQPSAHSTAYSSMCSQTSRGGALSEVYNGDTLGISSINNSQKNNRRQVVNPFSRKYGWRTGIEILAGKTVKKNADGFEDFRDYLSESEPDSLSSSGMNSYLSRTGTNFTREPSKLTEDHTHYDDSMSTSAEASHSASGIRTRSVDSMEDDTTHEEGDTPTYTRTQSMASNKESLGSEDEKTPKADKSSYTASSNSPDNDQINGKTPTQSYEETGEFTAGTATHSQGSPSQAESGGQTPTQGRIEEHATDPEITKASHMDIGGNKTGSITKSEDFTNSVVPSFRTRKRISFSVTDFNASRRSSKATAENKSEASIPVTVPGVNPDSDADSVDIIIVNEDEEETDRKSRGRKSSQETRTSATLRSSQAKSDDEQVKIKGQGRRSSKSIQNKNSSLVKRTRGARGKSLSSLLPLETSQLDSSEKQSSRKIRGRSMDNNSMELNSSDRRELTKAVIESHDRNNMEKEELDQQDDETASNASQEFLFFRDRRVEKSQTMLSKTQEIKATNKTQHKRKSSLLVKSLSAKDTASDFSADDSVDPNIEIEKWKKGKPKVGGKRKNELDVNKNNNVDASDEPPPHSPPKKLKGKKRGKDSSASRGRSKSNDDDDDPKILKEKSGRDSKVSDKVVDDVDTQDNEVFSDIEASELVIEEEVTNGSKSVRKRKSSSTKDSIPLGVSRNSVEIPSVTAVTMAEDSVHHANEEGGNNLTEKDVDNQESVSTTEKRRGSKTSKSSVSDSDLTTNKTPRNRSQKLPTKKSRKSSTDKSHVSDVNNSEEVTVPKTNASIHASRYIHSFLLDDHDKQEEDNSNKSSRSKSLGYKTRKAKTRNDSMKRKLNSAQKSNKFQSKSFSNGRGSVRKDVPSQSAADVSRRKSMKKSRSLHSAFIGTMESLPGKEDLPEDSEINTVEDIDPNDLYVEKEKVKSTRSKRKGQKQSQQLEDKPDERKTRTKGRQKLEKSKKKMENSVEDSMEEGDVEDVQNEAEHNDDQNEHNETGNRSIKNKTGQNKAKSLTTSKKRKGKSGKKNLNKSLDEVEMPEEVAAEVANEDSVDLTNGDVLREADDGTNMDDNEAMNDQPSVHDEVQQENALSRKQSLAMTPVSVYQVDEDLLKSGVSFRQRNRTLVKNSTMNFTTFDKTPVARKKQMSFMESPGPGLTPILRQPGSVKRGKKRRVTINHLVQEQSFQTGEHERLSTSVGSLSSMSLNTTPVHIFQTTTSESPVPQMLMPPQPKIFLPEDAPDGLRRSRRVRCQPVAWYKGERLVYERRKSGLGIKKVVPSHVEMLMMAQEAKRRKNVLKRRRQKGKQVKSTPSPRRNLSVHTTLDPELQDGSDSEIPVMIPGTDEEVIMECFSSKDSEVFVGPSKHDPISSDPYVMSLRLNQKQFMMGSLYLRPLKTKPEQIVNKGTMVFCLLKGKISVTIHRTKRIMEAGDMFFIPQGNTYSMENLRREEARLTFSCYKFGEDESSSSSE
ncbi:centromere protein C-like [Crassostrea angulata]|uniref:centromere protein C-like n=1 Tax=Magallana angulata TaxID=2784310 RepID=UPI0022B0ED01|nr:centromere protein C-like [Crassostrea angulata]